MRVGRVRIAVPPPLGSAAEWRQSTAFVGAASRGVSGERDMSARLLSMVEAAK